MFNTQNLITNIKITDNISTGNIKYLIFFDNNWYSFKNNIWEIQQLTIGNILNNGMTASLINNITETQYKQIGNIRKLNFAVCLSINDYDTKISLNNISLTIKPFNIKRKVKDNLYNYNESYNTIEILWNHLNVDELHIII